MSTLNNPNTYVFRRNMTVPQNNVNIFSGNGGKNTLIMVLIGLLILSFLNINVLLLIGQLFDRIVGFIGPLLRNVYSLFAYSTGTVLDKTSDTVANVAKSGIDIANGAVDNVAKIMIESSKLDGTKILPTTGEPKPDDSSNPIQRTISSNKNTWCLIGEANGSRACIEIDQYDKCLSGKIFQTQQKCETPSN